MTDGRELEGRVGDALARADRGEIAGLDFLSPSEAAEALRIISRTSPASKAHLYGGYPDAERCMLFILPDYIDEWQDYLAEDAICAVRIIGSGYETLSHSAYMGALLSLGLDRRVLGDIIPTGECEAVVFMKPATGSFLLSDERPLTRIARDTVKIRPYDGDGSELSREYEGVSGTVASPRFDAVAAELANMSREKIKSFITSGDARLNYEIASPSDEVGEGDIISVRGRGKFRVLSVSTKTGRGRYRLCALKYK